MCDFLYDFEVVSDIRYFPDPAIVSLRDDLDVARGLRVYIQESQEVVVFVHYVRRNFSGDDFAEDAGDHKGKYITGSSKVRPRY